MLTPVQERLAESLEAEGTVWVRLAVIQRLFLAERPRTSEHAERRAKLAADLEALVAAGRAVLPRRAWDRTATPALPEFVRVTPRRVPREVRHRVHGRGYGWRPELAFAAERDWSPRRLEELQKINRFLGTAAGRPIVPLRERSAMLFDHEKRLSELLVDPVLFGPGRLSLELLRTYRTSPPFHEHVVDAERRDGLIVENWDTFVALRTAYRNVGLLLYGAGAHVTAALPSLVADGRQAVSELRYFGDLDADGLAIAARADGVSRELGMGPVRPALDLYRLLLEHGRTQPTAVPKRVDTLTAWLEEPDVADAAAALLSSGHRIAQECVGVELLSSATQSLGPD